jgi:hypothetical protein
LKRAILLLLKKKEQEETITSLKIILEDEVTISLTSLGKT